jgi:hypothetical protein
MAASSVAVSSAAGNSDCVVGGVRQRLIICRGSENARLIVLGAGTGGGGILRTTRRARPRLCRIRYCVLKYGSGSCQ